MLKVRFVNITFNKMCDAMLPCKPSIGDGMPINYNNEVVNKIVFVTEMLIKQDNTLQNTDLLIYLD
ncbi:hypothetical protein S140_218 [Shewanella sp. phage 1/40]|uniref:hypothetical protein n=1 Tax=Shewanella sp. phage 1/40 TaxID=1458860 RepID=UPI0004F7EAA0|nr:hypothetical protein S140_218 [Shewanella sp. phage 1/40]AHK11625.1 hypothetical protein S140_218 [Shewanella sp. phage 1/40]